MLLFCNIAVTGRHMIIPCILKLDQDFPYPFITTTNSRQLPKDIHIILKVYDFTCREVKILVAGKQSKGDHTFKFYGEDLPAGVYFYQLQVYGNVQTMKIIVNL